MDEEKIMKIILDEAFYVHKTIRPGMLEQVYKKLRGSKTTSTWLECGGGAAYPRCF